MQNVATALRLQNYINQLQGEIVMCIEFEKYNSEVREKWGKTEAYNEYTEKTKDYSSDKWSSLADGINDVLADFSVYMKNGTKPDSVEAQMLVKKLQSHITENCYTCTDEILAGLGQMYVLDERFKNNIDKNGDGTAEFISNAIELYCKKQSK